MTTHYSLLTNFSMKKILIATGNQGKFKELMEVLGDLPFEFVSLKDVGITTDVEETGKTYADNAILKAEHFGKMAGLPAISDDSGIVVEALEGELGVHTRRWGAGAKATDQEWLDFFLNRMRTEENRRTEFISVVAFYNPEKPTVTFKGECTGSILQEPQVDLEPGIPLSSVFLPDGFDKVYSALTKHEKNQVSHRGKAVHALYQYLKDHY